MTYRATWCAIGLALWAAGCEDFTPFPNDEPVCDSEEPRPIGARPIDRGVRLTDLDARGEDGLSSALTETGTWSFERVALVPSTLDWSMTMRVSGDRDGFAINPQIEALEQPDPNGGTDAYRIGLTPTFGLADYDVIVVDDDGGETRLEGWDSGQTAVYLSNDPICDFIGKSQSVALGFCEWVVAPSFQQNQDGSCQWTFIRPEVGTFQLADGRELRGREVRFVEVLTAPVERATFYEGELRGANLLELVAFGETRDPSR